jgi:hypothetical protein
LRTAEESAKVKAYEIEEFQTAKDLEVQGMQEELEELEEEVQDRGVRSQTETTSSITFRLRFASSSSTRRLHLPHQLRMLTLLRTSTSLRSFHRRVLDPFALRDD